MSFQELKILNFIYYEFELIILKILLSYLLSCIYKNKIKWIVYNVYIIYNVWIVYNNVYT